jgi:hypothetical protein
MLDVIELVQQWGPYMSLPIIVAFITQGLKTKVPFFQTILGLRLIHFLPLLLGLAGGFLLPEDTWQDKLLVGGGLGSLSLFLYKVVTVSLAKRAVLEEKLVRKSLEFSEDLEE